MAMPDDPFAPDADPYPPAGPAAGAAPASDEAAGPCPACSRRRFNLLLAVAAAGALTGCAPLIVEDVRRIACEPIRPGANRCRQPYCRYYGGMPL